MALSIGVSVGRKVFIGDSVVTVHATVSSPETDIIEVSVDDGPLVQLTEWRTVELLPEVRAFVGKGPRQSHGGYRIAFETPRRIMFVSGEQGEGLIDPRRGRRQNPKHTRLFWNHFGHSDGWGRSH
jgi:hypothetical protein